MNFLEISPYVFGSSLTWYSVLMLLGALVCYIICDYFYKKEPESKKCPDLMLNTLLIAFPAGLLGGRIWYVLSEWDYYFNDPIAILKVWEGGLAIQGGVMLGVLAGAWYVTYKCRKHGINLKLTRLMDIVIPNILIAQVIGRWGNFFNREVYGDCVDGEKLWFLPNFIKEYMRGGTISGEYIACSANQYAQPLFLYEGILNFIGFILISIVLRKFFTKRIDGTLSALYLVWYGAIRASLEGLRNEMFIMRWGNISQSVLTSIVFVLVGIAFIVYLYIKDYQDKKKINLKNTVSTEIEIKEKEVEVAKAEVIDVDNKTKTINKKSNKQSVKKVVKKDEK